MNLLIFIYYFNFSGSHGFYKLMILRDAMPHSLVHVFRHFAKTTHPPTEQTKEKLEVSASTGGSKFFRNVRTHLAGNTA